MKKILITFTLLFISNIIVSQSKKKEPNVGVIRLVILNDNNEVLIKKASIGWVTVDTFLNETKTINEVIKGLSNKYGLSIGKPQLKGLFTYKFNFKNSSSLRQVYVVKSLTNKLPNKTNTEFHWVSKSEAVRKLKSTIPSLGEIVSQVLSHPQIVSGGSFMVKRHGGKLDSFQTEDFYVVNDSQMNKCDKDYFLVKTTLQKYMKGSSYNNQDLIKSAFTNNATLYLTKRDGSFKTYTAQEYAGFFKNGKAGVFNGRDAKVLAIEVVKDIATAKVEIAGPNRKWVYIDLFLLKRQNDEWKIISKTATRVDDNKK